jgi:outer membrane protein assembly factor BamB
MRKRILITLIFLAALAAQAAARAQELWSVALGARAAQAPLVADIHDAAGPETIAVLESGGARAIQADGVLLWSAELGAPPVTGSEAALTPKRDGAAPLLIAPLTGGTVAALNAATGAPAWKATAPLGEGPAWAAAADLDGDAAADAIVASASGTVIALSGTDGALLWEYPGGADVQLTALSGPPCVADIDDDDAPEIFLAGKEGVLSLDAEGKTRFLAPIEGGTRGGAAASDTDDDGTFEVYCVAAGATLHALDANTGEPLWGVVLEGEDAASPRLAVADIDQDETGEVLVVGKRATIVSHDGKAIFSRSDAGAGPALGDVNSDGEIEIALGTGAVISLLDAALQPVGKVALAAAAQTPPVLAAINGATVLCVGEDNALRAVRAGARLMGQLAPWTQPRRDAAGGASTLSPLREQDRFAEAPQLAPANAALSFAGGFEDATLAAQWTPASADGAAAQDTATKASGAASLKTTAGAAELRVSSPAAAAPSELRRVNASVLARGAGARAFLAWERVEGAPVFQELRAADTTPEGWRRYPPFKCREACGRAQGAPCAHVACGRCGAGLLGRCAGQWPVAFSALCRGLQQSARLRGEIPKAVHRRDNIFRAAGHVPFAERGGRRGLPGRAGPAGADYWRKRE